MSIEDTGVSRVKIPIGFWNSHFSQLRQEGTPDLLIFFGVYILCVAGGQEFGGSVLIDLLQDFIA